MLFVLVTLDMVKDKAVGMHLLNIVEDGCEDGVVIANGVVGVHGVIELVDSFDNSMIVAVHMYWSGSFQVKGV